MAQLPHNDRPPKTSAELDAFTIGGACRHVGPILLADYDDAWPELFRIEAERITDVLGSRTVSLEHVGSTSVPGLCAKPIIDIVMEVEDSSDESSYVIDLETMGYELRIREPNWWEHRVLKGSNPDVNLHVFTRGCPEVERMIKFRDRLRADPSDRELYEAKKRELASRSWDYVQDYADAKTNVIAEIMARTNSDAA